MLHSFSQSMNLSDEILLVIFKELNLIDILNLVGIKVRLNNSDKFTYLFCLKILSEIYHKIKWLNLEV
jgi:hypothetical protein